MKLSRAALLISFIGVLFVATSGTTFAAFGDLGSRLDRIQERIEDRTSHIEERLENARDRILESQQRLCDRFDDRGLGLPSFCDDEEPEPEPEAPTLDLNASPDEIEEGATSTLSWDSEDADGCEASDGWNGAKGTSGEEIVSPDITTTYTLTCVGEGGTTTESVTVTVTEDEPEPEAPTLDLNASPDEIEEGATSTLSWESENTDTCEASDGWSGAKDTDGSMVVTPATTTVYTLTCVGEGGTTTESVTVTVTEDEPEPDAPTLDLTAFPTSVLVDATSTLTWESEDAGECEASDGWSGAKALSGSEIVEVNATTTYTLTCVGEGGTTTESVTVIVTEEDEEPEPPAVDHLLISEVFYDVDTDTQGAEGDNEWVEIYNPTDSPVDLMDWLIGGSTSSADVISTTSLMLDPDEYLVITNATTTSDFWDLDDVTVVFLGSPITSSGLANIGDYVGLFDDSEELVDDVSYGTNEEAFSPSVPGVSEGNSIARIPVENDTDSADDWEESDPPTPGS